MADQFLAKISDVFPVPEFVPGIASLLEQIWPLIGFDTLDVDFDVPPVPPDLPDFTDAFTEDDSLALLDEFDEDSDGSDPVTGTGTPPTEAATFAQEAARVLGLGLAALSEVVVTIPGL